MNAHIIEIGSLLPSSYNASQRLDKLSVLRLALQYIRHIRGTTSAFNDESNIPVFLQADDIIDLLQQVANGFVAIIEVQHGQMIQLSDNVKKCLGFYQEELLHKSIFDLLHPRDVDVFKKQILCRREFQACGGDRCSKSSSGEEHQCIAEPAEFSCWPDWNSTFGTFSLGSRRIFFCRLKCRTGDEEAEKTELAQPPGYGQGSPTAASDGRLRTYHYAPFHCSGFLKSLPAAHSAVPTVSSSAVEAGAAANESLSICLILLVRPLLQWNSPGISGSEVEGVITDFTSRNAVDGTFIDMDHSTTFLTGYLPQELKGNVYYNFVHESDIFYVQELHKKALSSDECDSKSYKMKTRYNRLLFVTAHWQRFVNPWTKEVHSLIIRHHIVTQDQRSASAFETATPAAASNSYGQSILAQLLSGASDGSSSRE